MLSRHALKPDSQARLLEYRVANVPRFDRNGHRHISGRGWGMPYLMAAFAFTNLGAVIFAQNGDYATVQIGRH
jgi:hypothetical protein